MGGKQTAERTEICAEPEAKSMNSMGDGDASYVILCVGSRVLSRVTVYVCKKAPCQRRVPCRIRLYCGSAGGGPPSGRFEGVK